MGNLGKKSKTSELDRIIKLVIMQRTANHNNLG